MAFIRSLFIKFKRTLSQMPQHTAYLNHSLHSTQWWDLHHPSCPSQALTGCVAQNRSRAPCSGCPEAPLPPPHIPAGRRGPHAGGAPQCPHRPHEAPPQLPWHLRISRGRLCVHKKLGHHSTAVLPPALPCCWPQRRRRTPAGSRH